MNIGEELVSSYLRYICGCEFTQKNLYTVETQGEIDVVGINLNKKSVYVCEVAIHLVTGLRYKNNVQKLTDKLNKDIRYVKTHFPEYTHHVMLWSPMVKNGKQMGDIEKIGSDILNGKHKIKVEFVINEEFLSCVKKLRSIAREATSELKCPVMRFMQIEEWLNKHVAKMNAVPAPTISGCV